MEEHLGDSLNIFLWRLPEDGCFTHQNFHLSRGCKIFQVLPHVTFPDPLSDSPPPVSPVLPPRHPHPCPVICSFLSIFLHSVFCPFLSFLLGESLLDILQLLAELPSLLTLPEVLNSIIPQQFEGDAIIALVTVCYY